MRNNRQYTMHIGRNENLRDYTGYGIFENSTTTDGKRTPKKWIYLET